MSRIFSFALGYLTEDINSSKTKSFLDYLKKIGFQGVEITFGSKERLYSFKLNDSLKQKLRQFQHITIHSPFELVREAESDKEVIKQLDLIFELYSAIRAKRVIIHPDNLPKPEILKNYKFNISTENLKKKRGISIKKLKKLLEKYPKIGFCLDTAHAFSWSKHEIRKLVENFGNKINQIHLSARHKGKDHQSLRGTNKDFLLSVSPIEKLNIPIIIEEEYKKINFKTLKKEIEYIKKILGD